MPTFDDPTTDAAEAREALRGLAHATRRIDDPREIYAILGDVSAATASLSQALHQLAAVHDVRQRKTAWVPEDLPVVRAATYHVSWDLHRAGEMLRSVTACVDDAHQTEGSVVYQHRDFPTVVVTARPSPDHRLGL